jgi:serine/threonine protein phosphatase PrpC
MKISSTAIQGLREYMEDTVLIKECGNQTLLCVFDGHGGSEVANMCKDLFASIFSHNTLIRNIRAAFKNTYKTLDLQTFKTPTCGAVAASVLIDKDTIWVANCGDTEVMGITLDFRSCQMLSKRHKVIDEVNRLTGICDITKSHPQDTFRINHTLNVARAIGDHHQKAVICTPDVSHYKINKYKYIILASDGLWDVLNANDVKNIVEEYSKKGYDLKSICDILVEESLLKRSTDNISVVICEL